jgi:hypothetical protein
LPDGHAEREARGDDGACRSAADQIVIVGEHKAAVAGPPLQFGFHGLKKAEREDPLHAAAVEREDPFRTVRRVEMVVQRPPHGVPPNLP